MEALPTTIDYGRSFCCPPHEMVHVVVLHVSFIDTGPAEDDDHAM
jgi:hypothetical protein